MRNLLVEEIHERAHLLSGTGDAKEHCQVEAADSRSFDAAVFVGYHAMAKTQFAIHPHTIAGVAVLVAVSTGLRRYVAFREARCVLSSTT